MDKLAIVGGSPLIGTVDISGAKNSALPILFATLLTKEPCLIENVPNLRDVRSTVAVLVGLGAQCQQQANQVTVQADALNSYTAPYDLVRTMRASILTLGPLLARCGRACVSLPGGCAIGTRPVDVHLEGLKKMGADIHLQHGNIEATCERLRGADITLTKPSVTGTENLLMAAVLAEGDTVIRNAACEPEIVDLAHCLVSMGAKIEGMGSGEIHIKGVSALTGSRYRIMPDRIEAGTYLAAVAACGGDVLLRGAHEEDMHAVISIFTEGGVRTTPTADGLRVTLSQRFCCCGIETSVYPGFPTDMQAQLIAANCVGQGHAVVTETIFENRFMHVQELLRMGADITLHNNAAMITGVPTLTAAPVMATDLRASASLVIAALATTGKSIINRVYHLDRGYEQMEKKLCALGARVERLPSVT